MKTVNQIKIRVWNFLQTALSKSKLRALATVSTFILDNPDQDLLMADSYLKLFKNYQIHIVQLCIEMTAPPSTSNATGRRGKTSKGKTGKSDKSRKDDKHRRENEGYKAPSSVFNHPADSSIGNEDCDLSFEFGASLWYDTEANNSYNIDLAGIGAQFDETGMDSNRINNWMYTTGLANFRQAELETRKFVLSLKGD